MNGISNAIDKPLTTTDSVAIAASRARIRQRKVLVNVLRILVLVIIIGGWELGARTKIIDRCFWGQPSGILAQLVKWVTDGTAQGPLWQQIAVTLEEAVIGFAIGVVLGVVFGIILGRNQFLSDIFGPYLKAANSIP